MSKRHLESHTPLHDIWCGINKRCRHHPRYAGRGISACDEWSLYENFRDWALANGYKPGLTIERIDVNGNYCPENCKWIPLAEQARNRTTTRWVDYDGRKMSLAEAAELAGLPYKEVHLRIKSGWSEYDALHTPIQSPKSELRKICDERGLNYHTVYSRVHMYGWTVEDAVSTPTLGKGANQTSYRHA